MNRWGIAAVALLVLYFGVAAYGRLMPKDDTDPQDGRSGLILRIDRLTNCQYLVEPRGGITPRLDATGRHICERTPE